MHSVWTVDERAGPVSDRAALRPAGPGRSTSQTSARRTTDLRLVSVTAPAVVQGRPAVAAPMLEAGRSAGDPVACRPIRPNDHDQIVDCRALALWPRLDRRALTRCRGDARRIARYVARRTSLPLDAIVGMLDGA